MHIDSTTAASSAPVHHSTPYISRAMFTEGLALPRSWTSKDPLLEPHETIYQNRLRGLQRSTSVSPDIEDALVSSFFDASLSIPNLARQHDLTVTALIDWFSRPDVRARIERIREFAQYREETLTVERTITALHALEQCCQSLELDLAQDPDGSPPSAATKVRRSEVARKSAGLILRQSNRLKDRRADAAAGSGATGGSPPVRQPCSSAPQPVKAGEPPSAPSQQTPIPAESPSSRQPSPDLTSTNPSQARETSESRSAPHPQTTKGSTSASPRLSDHPAPPEFG
jgi:hypothetical protein